MSIRPISPPPIYDASQLRPADHPLPDAAQAYATYEDPGFFKTTLDFTDPPAHEIHPANDAIYGCLQALLDAEAISQLGQEKWDSLDDKKKDEHRFNIASSTVNRKDITATVQRNGRTFTTHHDMAHNSPMNGKRYRDADGRIIEITFAVASSQDRNTAGTQMLRRISNKQGTLVYTGRPDTPEKAFEQAQWLFFSELEAGQSGKGIAPQVDLAGNPEYDAQGHPIYTFTYVCDTVLSPGNATKMYGRDERVPLMSEIRELEALKDVPDGHLMTRNNKTIRVHLLPIVVDNVFNLGNELMRTGADWLSGRKEQEEITQKGLAELSAYALQRKGAIAASTRLTSGEKARLNKEIDDALKMCDERFHSYTPEQKVLALYRLCKALNLPEILHCMSSKDRTGICVALVSALDQYEQTKGHLDYDRVLQDEEFKELFAANLMIGHNISRYGRGAAGEFAGEQLEELFGLDMNANQALYRLLPARYVESAALWKKASGAVTFIPLLIVNTLGGIIGTFIHMCKERSWKSVGSFLAFLLVWSWVEAIKITLNFYVMIPDLQLNKHAFVVKDRGLTKQKEEHPFATRLQPAIDQVQKMTKARLIQLTKCLENREAHVLSEQEQSLMAQIALGHATFERMLANPKLVKRLTKEQADFLRVAVQANPRAALAQEPIILEMRRKTLEEIRALSEDLDQPYPKSATSQFVAAVYNDLEVCHTGLSDPALSHWLMPEAVALMRKAIQHHHEKTVARALRTLHALNDDLPELTQRMAAQDLSQAFAQTLNPQGDDEEALLLAELEKSLILQIGMGIEHFRHMVRNPALMATLSANQQAFIRAAVAWDFYKLPTTEDEALCGRIDTFMAGCGTWNYPIAGNALTANIQPYLGDNGAIEMARVNAQVDADFARQEYYFHGERVADRTALLHKLNQYNLGAIYQNTLLCSCQQGIGADLAKVIERMTMSRMSLERHPRMHQPIAHHNSSQNRIDFYWNHNHWEISFLRTHFGESETDLQTPLRLITQQTVIDCRNGGARHTIKVTTPVPAADAERQPPPLPIPPPPA